MSPPTYNRSYANAFGVGTSFDPKYGTTPYVTQWNINLQKALPGKVVVDLGYMGNHSVKTLNSDLVRVNQTPTSDLRQVRIGAEPLDHERVRGCRTRRALSVPRLPGHGE